ncbi:mucin-17-like [Anopheles moucheti]|uniref:mucin-17-like n=1 Tax=Anopheles moucheti TaxID=186751 RepID=UPI0022F08226|nr:mucin-17-like [Anopheles moucheti]
MQRATISVFCIALAVGLTTGSPLFYESARVLNKVEFSDIGVDGDRIDPLIEESEEEQPNITVSSHTDISEVRKNGSAESTDTGEQTEPVLKVTVISSNGLPDEEVTGSPHISTTKTIEETLTTAETTTILIPEKTTEQTTQLMPKMSTKDIQRKEESATASGETSITTNLVDNGETSDVTTIFPTEEDTKLEKEITSIVYNGNDETSDVTTISPTEDGQNLLERETTITILPTSTQQNTAEDNAKSSIEVSSEEMVDTTVLVTTETIPVTVFMQETRFPETTTEEVVLSTEPTESATESTVTNVVNITETVTAAETTPVYYSSEIVEHETSMAISSTTVALIEDIATESDTVTTVKETETTTVLQTTLRSSSFTENEIVTITTDSNNPIDVEAIDTTTKSYSTSEIITEMETSETTTDIVVIITSTSIAFSEEPTVTVTSASVEDITSSTFEITSAGITKSVTEDNFQTTTTNEYALLSTAGEAVPSISITTDSSDRHMLTTGEIKLRTDSEYATTVGKGHDMSTTTFTEEVALTTTEESASITTMTTDEVDEEITTGSSSNRSVNTENEYEITQHPVTSTSAGMEASFEETSDSVTVTSTNNDVSQQSTGIAAISSETEAIETTETFTTATFAGEEEPSAITLTTETNLPPITHDVSASDESFSSSQFLTEESTDQDLDISSSAAITILALVTAPPGPSTTHGVLGLTESEHKSTEIFSTESSFTQMIILEETEVVSNEAVVTLPDISEDSVANAIPGTTSPQLNQESSLNALTTPSIDSGSIL